MNKKRIDRRSDGRFDMNLRQSIASNPDAASSQYSGTPNRPHTMHLYSRQNSIVPEMERQPQSPKEDPDMAHTKDFEKADKTSDRATKLYTICYLIFFGILGTLARLGLQALTFFPGAPIVFSELWANFAGTMIMGFLMEDRMLFKEEWGIPLYEYEIQKSKMLVVGQPVDLVAAKKAHGAVKKTIPFYIGLTTGFCGSFTSFSSFIRDTFLALSNDLPTPLDHPSDFDSSGNSLSATTSTVSRNPGFSILAVLAVIIITMSLSVRALYIGVHLAQAVERYVPTIPFQFTRRYLDRFIVVIALGSWAIVTVLAIFPPNPDWRGIALFALVFAPLGGLLRFYVSMYLNPWFPAFPLGTFIVNIMGTTLLGMSFDFQHSAISSVISCQVFQGIMDGFCGSLTTISTWIVELTTLKKKAAYLYGSLSIGVALSLLVAVMGTFRWTVGFADLKCIH